MGAAIRCDCCFLPAFGYFLRPLPTAIVSDVLATLLGCWLAVQRDSPLIALVVSLALYAVSDQMERRMQELDPNDVRLTPGQWDPAALSSLETPGKREREALESALAELRCQYLMAGTTAAICAITAAVVLYRTASASEVTQDISQLGGLR